MYKKYHPLNTVASEFAKMMVMEPVPADTVVHNHGLKPPGTEGNPVGNTTWAWICEASGPNGLNHVANIALAIIDKAYVNANIQAPDGTWGAKAQKSGQELHLTRYGPGKRGKWQITDSISIHILLDDTLPAHIRGKFHNLARAHPFVMCNDIAVDQFYIAGPSPALTASQPDVFHRAPPQATEPARAAKRRGTPAAEPAMKKPAAATKAAPAGRSRRGRR